MNKNKGILFYYDWLEPLTMLTGDEFKKLFISMINYHKDGVPPPAFGGLTDMAAGFIFPQIRRMKENVETGKKGGRPKKQTDVNNTDVSNNDADINDSADIDNACADTYSAKDCNSDINNKEGTAPISAEDTRKDEIKSIYGKFGNVLLTKKEYSSLKKLFALNYSERIDRLSRAIKFGECTAQSHYTAILNERYT